MPGMGVGRRVIKVGMRGIRVGMRGIRVGMREIEAGMWVTEWNRNRKKQKKSL